VKARYSPRARQRVQYITRWWRKNRTSAPSLFEDELDEAIGRLEADPNLGTEYRVVRGHTIRRMLLRKTEQHVFYSVDDENGVVVIHSVWGARRGRGPKL
jgi:plasmid stabilization system protein ParE